ETPKNRYEKNCETQNLFSAEDLKEIFLWEEERTVRKTAVVEIEGNLYDVDSSLRGKRIQVRYNPYDLSYIQVWKDDQRFPDARPAELRKQSHSKLPESSDDDGSPAIVSDYLE